MDDAEYDGPMRGEDQGDGYPAYPRIQRRGGMIEAPQQRHDNVSPLTRKIHRVFEHVSELEQEITTLTMRLRPVLRPASETDDGEMKTVEHSDRTDQSPIADSLEELAARVRRARNNLGSLLEILEV